MAKKKKSSDTKPKEQKHIAMVSDLQQKQSKQNPPQGLENCLGFGYNPSNK